MICDGLTEEMQKGEIIMDDVRIHSIGQMLKKGIAELFNGEQYQNFLKITARFPHYSYRNLILLLGQCPHATAVKGFRGWLSVGRIVRSGERGIRIIAPYVKAEEKQNSGDDKGDEADIDKFRRISVFDISQTDRLDGVSDATVVPQVLAIPTLFPVKELTGDVDGFSEIYEALERISPFPIVVEVMNGNKKGYCNYTKEMIAVKQGLSQLHTIKTCIHEIAHAILHRRVKNKQQKEMEAESVAYVVCQYFGLDTSDYSFGYIAGYSMGKENKEIAAFLDQIQKSASYLIDFIDGAREGIRIDYDNSDLCVLTNSKTAARLYDQGMPVYLVYPGQGELFVLVKQQIGEHNGPYAVERQMLNNRIAA